MTKVTQPRTAFIDLLEPLFLNYVSRQGLYDITHFEEKPGEGVVVDFGLSSAIPSDPNVPIGDPRYDFRFRLRAPVEGITVTAGEKLEASGKLEISLQSRDTSAATQGLEVADQEMQALKRDLAYMEGRGFQSGLKTIPYGEVVPVYLAEVDSLAELSGLLGSLYRPVTGE